MGEVPEWYELITAAKYLGVAPWDLLEQPLIWQEGAHKAEMAEYEARKQREASAARKAK